jgi:predicted transport protein
MNLYSIKKNTIDSVGLNPFKKEREIQELVEKNTETLFDVEFVCSEFKIGEFRIDTLCFDNESNSFVIIEYKKGSSYSVIDQGYSYLSKMLNNKDSFILEYCKRKKVSVDIEVDWSQSKIIFVSPSFNSYQKNSVNFKDMNKFELWEIKRFTNNTIVLNQYQSKSNESIEKITGKENSVMSKVNKEVKVYDEDYHISKVNNTVLQLWDGLKEVMLELDDIEMKHTKGYINFMKEGKRLCEVVFRKNYIDINITRGSIKVDKTKSRNYFNWDDPKNLSREYSWTWKSGEEGHVYTIKYDNTNQLDYMMFLVKQKYETLN